MASFTISSIISAKEKAREMIVEGCDVDVSGEPASTLLSLILQAISQIERFKHEENLDSWLLEINQTADEGIEFLIIHSEMDLLVFIMEDDDDYELEDVMDTISLDSFTTSQYNEFLLNKSLQSKLIRELELWEMDSDYHPYAIAHLKFIMKKGFDLQVFGGKKDIQVELNWDNEELFVGAVDEESMSANPDYNLPHEHFNLENPEEAIELGVQAWTEFDEEDDDWEADLDEDEELEDDFDDDWDPETDEEWDPGFEDET